MVTFRMGSPDVSRTNSGIVKEALRPEGRSTEREGGALLAAPVHRTSKRGLTCLRDRRMGAALGKTR